MSHAQARIALALHGGAGPIRNPDTSREEALLAEVCTRGRERLRAGAAALDVVVEAVAALEDAGLFIAGRGASPNRNGVWELDASVMDGASRRAGAVGALVGFQSPIAVARGVMERTPHVLLVGAGARAFAEREGFATVADPAAYYTPSVPTAPGDGLVHGTVGAVARDAEGRLAAATSTGGLLGKTPGRIGDSPIIGAGTWADERVAVSCTGQGEYFLRAAVAADVSARIRYGRYDLARAAFGALDDMHRQGGDGGLIAVDAAGRVALPYTSQGMRRAWLDPDGTVRAATFQ
jgi:L-asparaginase/beta-aspartyl-peptidase (threonine type)